MRNAVILLALLLPSLAEAQDAPCLSDQRGDNRLSGRVEFESFKHPTREGVTISGYKLLLLKPQCYDHDGVEGGRGRADMIKVVLLVPSYYGQGMDDRFFKSRDAGEQWRELERFLKPRVGKLVSVSGTMTNYNTIYWLAWPQIAIGALADCQLAPTSKAMAKC